MSLGKKLKTSINWSHPSIATLSNKGIKTHRLIVISLLGMAAITMEKSAMCRSLRVAKHTFWDKKEIQQEIQQGPTHLHYF